MRYGDFEYIKIDSGIRIASYLYHSSIGFDQRVNVPYNIDGLPVVEIGKNSFRNSATLKEIHLPYSIQVIGYRAFVGCSRLRKIHLPDSLQSIGKEAFKNCSCLREIHLPDSLQSIGEEAFEGCNSLKEIHLPDSVQTIGKKAFPDNARIIRYTPKTPTPTPTAKPNSSTSTVQSLPQKIIDLQKIPNVSEEISRELIKLECVLKLNPSNAEVEKLVNEVLDDISLALELQGKINSPTAKLVELMNSVSTTAKISIGTAGLNAQIKNKIRTLMIDYAF